MTVSLGSGDGVAIVVLDTIASVCDSTSSTMTGAGVIEGDSLVIPAPDYRCDDGSEAHLLNGDPTPLNEILRNLTYVRDPARDVLKVGKVIWERLVTEAPSPTPVGSGQALSLIASVFVGNWTATDNPPDSSNLTMAVNARPDGRYDVVIHDDSAAVCGATPSAMTGLAQETVPGTFVIAQPDYRCDDGTEAKELSGPPLAVQLADYTFQFDQETDQLLEPSGVVWSRDG
jgi:hypothetical protein